MNKKEEKFLLDDVKKNSSVYVFPTEELGEVFFSSMSMEDVELFNNALLKSPTLAIEYSRELVVKYVISPKLTLSELQNKLAGTVDTLFNLLKILSVPSGVNVIEYDLAFARSKRDNDLFLQATAFICKAFPAYTPDDLKEKKWEEVVELIALAEYSVGEFKLEKKKEPKKIERNEDGRLFDEDPREVFLKENGDLSE